MIAFQQQELRIVKANPRQEFHGDNEVFAMDLRVEMTVPNTMLDRIDDRLRASLYRGDGNPDLLGPDEEHMPNVRFRQLGSILWSASISPASLTLHLGTKKNEVTLSDSKFNKLRITPLAGGTCELIWRLQCYPTEEEAARIMTVLRHTIKGTLDTSEATIDGDDDE